MRAAFFVTLLFAGAALAGCVDVNEPLDAASLPEASGLPATLPTITHLPGGKIVDAPDLPAIAGELLPLGHDAVEPTLGITSTGTIFYAAADFDAGTPDGFPATAILRSTDGGLTWEDVSPRLPTGDHNPPHTGDPYVFVDPRTDRVFSFDMFPLLACGYLSFSDDEGDTWTTQPAACAQGVPYDHQTITAGPAALASTPLYDGYVLQCVNRITDALCARSLDGGLTWSPTAPAFLGVDPEELEPGTDDPLGGVLESFCGGLHGHLAIGPDGTAYLPKSHCGDPFLGISRDDGLTWTQVDVAPDLDASGGPDPAVAVDAAGNVYYLFTTEEGGLALVTSTDAGKTWGEPLHVAHPDVTATHLPTLAAGDEGKIAFAYLGTENLPDGYENEEFDMRADERAADGHINNATWNGYVSVIHNALSDEPVIQTTLVNPREDPLVRGYCGPGRCPGNYDFIDIVISPVDGQPYAAFVDACVDACAGPDGTHEDSRAFAGQLAKLVAGPRLIG